MPVLFHTGVMVRPDAFMKFSPRCPKVDFAAMDVSCRRMDPMCLDTIARAFPKLKLIMAHFGSTGRRDNAAGILQWNPNIWGDLTSFVWAWTPEVLKRQGDMLKQFCTPALAEKLVFGTDNMVSRGTERMPKHRKSVLDLLKALGVKKPVQKRVMGGTMDELLGLEG